MYIPVQTGADESPSIGYQGDNTGDNISNMHYRFRELVTMYWGGKNLDCDYYGFCHYRRYFCYKKKSSPQESILNREEAENLLSKNDIILPKRRKYYIQTLDRHFNQMKFTKDTDLPLLRTVLESVDIKYAQAFDVVMKRTWGHMFGVFIMEKNAYNKYSDWYFSILWKLESKINYTVIPKESTRYLIVAYLAEFLMDIYIEANELEYKEVPLVFLEGGYEIKKRIKFLVRFFRKK